MPKFHLFIKIHIAKDNRNKTLFTILRNINIWYSHNEYYVDRVISSKAGNKEKKNFGTIR